MANESLSSTDGFPGSHVVNLGARPFPWMNLSCCKLSSTSCTKRVKSFIVRLFGSCLLFSGSVANADLTNDVHQIGIDLQTLLADLNTYSGTLDGDLVAIQNQLSNYLQPLHQEVVSGNNTLTSILTALNGSSDSSLANRLRDLQYMINGAGGLYQSQNIFSYLSQIAQNTANSAPTNIYNVQVDARDILAGNPWWATNSVFARTYSTASRVIPTVSGNDLMSFPELMSFWSAQLLPFSGSGRVNVVSPSAGDYWLNMWGHNRQNSGNAWQGRSFSWFDWMSEVQKTNLAWQVQVLSALRGMTNTLPDVAFDDILAGNPYWSTNSQFSPDWHLWYDQAPRPRGTPASFPESFSLFLSSRLRMYHSESLPSEYFDSWGIGGDNTIGADNWQVYSFEDWLADYLKSNLVLTTSTSFSNLTSELYEAGYDTDDLLLTNSPLPEYSLPDDSLSEATDALQQGQTTVSGFIDHLPKPGTGGNSEIVVIPEFTVGGIHVSEYRADLSTSIVPVCRQVLSFLYGVSLFCGIFVLAKGEYAFWISWGRYWDKA